MKGFFARGVRLAACCTALCFIASSAYSATLSATVTIAGTNGKTLEVGGTEFVPAAASISGVSFTGLYPTTGGTPLDWGTLTEQSIANSNVTPNFVVNITPTINGATGSTVAFYGSIDGFGDITLDDCSDVSCSSPNQNHTYNFVNYPFSSPSNAMMVYDTTSVTISGVTSYYNIGIQENPTTAKITPLVGYIAPASAPSAPEPLSAGLTGVSMLGLLGLIARKKLQRSQN